jgi:hypothetical protein
VPPPATLTALLSIPTSSHAASSETTPNAQGEEENGRRDCPQDDIFLPLGCTFACAERLDPLSDLLVPGKGTLTKAVWLGGFPHSLISSKSETSEPDQHIALVEGSGTHLQCMWCQGVREPKSFIATHRFAEQRFDIGGAV